MNKQMSITTSTGLVILKVETSPPGKFGILNPYGVPGFDVCVLGIENCYRY